MFTKCMVVMINSVSITCLGLFSFQFTTFRKKTYEFLSYFFKIYHISEKSTCLRKWISQVCSCRLQRSCCIKCFSAVEKENYICCRTSQTWLIRRLVADDWFSAIGVKLTFCSMQSGELPFGTVPAPRRLLANGQKK